METAFRFMPSSLLTASFFVNGKTFNQTESMSFWWFVSVAGCVLIFMLVLYISSACPTSGQI